MGAAITWLEHQLEPALPLDVIAYMTQYLNGSTTGKLRHLTCKSISNMPAFFGTILRLQGVIERNGNKGDEWYGGFSTCCRRMKYYPFAKLGRASPNLIAITSLTCKIGNVDETVTVMSALAVQKSLQCLLVGMPALQYLECNQFLLTQEHTTVIRRAEMKLLALKELKVLYNEWEGNPFSFNIRTLLPYFSAPNLTTIDLTKYGDYFPLDDFTYLEHIKGVTIKNLLPYGRKMSTKIDAECQFTLKPYYRMLKSMTFRFMHSRNPLEHEYAAVLFASLVHAKQFECLDVLGDALSWPLEKLEFAALAPLNHIKVLKVNGQCAPCNATLVSSKMTGSSSSEDLCEWSRTSSEDSSSSNSDSGSDSD